MDVKRFKTALKQADDAKCARVNLALWYALKRDHLCKVALVTVKICGAEMGVLLPCVGKTIVVLDPDLTSATFVIDQESGKPTAVNRPNQSKGIIRTTQRWLGRH